MHRTWPTGARRFLRIRASRSRRATSRTWWSSGAIAPRLRNYDLVIVLHSAAGDRMSVSEGRPAGFASAVASSRCSSAMNTIFSRRKLPSLANAASDYICTQLPLDAARQLYSDCDAELVAMPHALNPAGIPAAPRHRTDDRCRIRRRSVRAFDWRPRANRHRAVLSGARRGCTAWCAI